MWFARAELACCLRSLISIVPLLFLVTQCEYLLGHGSSIDERQEDISAMLFAAQGGSVETVIRLAHYGGSYKDRSVQLHHNLLGVDWGLFPLIYFT